MSDPFQLHLTRPERQWLEGRRLDAERKAQEEQAGRSRSMPTRMRRATDRWSLEAGWVASGLTGASVTLAPAAQSQGRSSGPSDPTGAQLYRTLDAVADAAWQWAHLTGPCPLDGVPILSDRTVDDDRGSVHVCPAGSAVELAEQVGVEVDPTEVVDGLAGTPSSSPRAFGAIVDRAAAWHAEVASLVQGAFDAGWRGGVENSKLEDWATRADQLSRRMAGLAGSLSEWSGRSERTCKAGCGAAVPVPDSPERGGRTCDRCLKRQSRERLSEAS